MRRSNGFRDTRDLRRWSSRITWAFQPGTGALWLAGWAHKSHWRREAYRAGVEWLGDDEHDWGNTWLEVAGVASGRCRHWRQVASASVGKCWPWLRQSMLFPHETLTAAGPSRGIQPWGAHQDHHCIRVHAHFRTREALRQIRMVQADVQRTTYHSRTMWMKIE